MLHAAAMLIGIFALALAVFGRGLAPEALAAAAMIAATCVMFALRFGGVGKNGFSAPQSGLLGVARAGAIVQGALATIRRAVAADVTLRPALVRVKTRASDAFARAVLADQMSAAPGAVVVDADTAGFLVHVTDEESVDAAELGALEARVLGALGERAAT